MSEETTDTKENTTTEIPLEKATEVSEVADKTAEVKEAAPNNLRRGAPTSFRRGNRASARGPRKGSRERHDRIPEFAQKIIGIRRVTRVMAGGRRFSFSVAMVLGDKKGRVGVGVGKASDTALAIEKAMRDAKKNMLKLPLTESKSIAHNVGAKYGSSIIEIRPARGRGLVAGASLRTVLELAGVSDVTAKVLSRSKNKTNIARATIQALKTLER